MSGRAARQRFSIGYHLNSWDLAGLPLRPAIDFLAGQGFRWFELLAFTSLSDQYARKYMQLGNQAPMGVTTDTDILRRYAILSEAQREAVVLRLELGLTHDEISTALECPSADAARMLISRGLIRLAEEMGDFRGRVS